MPTREPNQVSAAETSNVDALDEACRRLIDSSRVHSHDHEHFYSVPAQRPRRKM